MASFPLLIVRKKQLAETNISFITLKYMLTYLVQPHEKRQK